MKRIKKKIVIKADSFIKGNFNKTNHPFGKGIIIDGGFEYGCAEYDVYIPKTAKYELRAKYASFDERAVDVYLDNEIIAIGILNFSTGGWSREYLKWQKIGLLYIKEGKHKLKIFTNSFIPHIERFEFRIYNEGKLNKQGFLNDSLEIYRHSLPYQIFFKSLISNGIQTTLNRVYRYIKSGNFVKDYLDYFGIFDGHYAYKGPNFVQLDITNSCNNNCIGCWCNSPLLKDKAMQPDERKEKIPLYLIKELIDELHSMGTREIYLSGGGEPFTHPDIIPILRYIKKKDLICYINTNFTLIDENIIKELIKLKIEHLTVSIWAGTPEIYDKTHPNKTENTFFRIKSLLKKINSEKVHFPLVKLYNVIFSLNFHEVDEMIQFALDTCSDSVEFTVIDTIPERTDQLLLNETQRLQLVEKCRQIQSQIKNGYFKDKLVLFRFSQFLRRISAQGFTLKAEYDKGFLDSLPCYIGWVFSRINANGDVNSCLKSHRIPVGNIYENSFKKIWNSQRQREFRNITLTQPKSHSYFSLIGNDPSLKTGCYKSCDDIGRNIHTHKKIMSLSIIEEYLIKSLVFLNKYRRIYLNTNNKIVDSTRRLEVERKKISSDEKKILYNNLDLIGTLDSRRAFIGPEQVVIDLTNRCDTNCIACWVYSPYLNKHRPSNEWLKTELSYEIVKELIDQLSKIRTKRIRFTGGGEPLLHPKIFQLCEYVKSKGMKCALTTNFLRITEKNLDKLGCLDELAVSIWAASDKMYKKIHSNRKKNDFVRIEKLLNKLTKSLETEVPFTTICNVLMNINYHEIVDMYNLALELNVDAVYFTPVDIIPNATDRFLLSEEQKLFVLKKLEEIHNSKLRKIKIENYQGLKKRLTVKGDNIVEYDREEIDSIPCYVGWIFARVLANGDVCPCCRGVKKTMGNIYKDNFYDIWFSKRYNEFRCKAKFFKKDHPYFKNIECYKECDNLIHNRMIDNRIKRSSSADKKILRSTYRVQ